MEIKVKVVAAKAAPGTRAKVKKEVAGAGAPEEVVAAEAEVEEVAVAIAGAEVGAKSAGAIPPVGASNPNQRSGKRS